jgi:hypothetical protein
MKGWKEEEFKNKDLMAPCGLYCGTCGVYIATRDKNIKFKAVMGNLYGTKPEETQCLGCMQPDPPKKLYGWCQICKIRSCVKSKSHYSCHQCEEWPCNMIENFGFATGVRVMKKLSLCGVIKSPNMAIKKEAWNGRDRNATVIFVLHVESHYFEALSDAGLAIKM